jgi:hypothetical protein
VGKILCVGYSIDLQTGSIIMITRLKIHLLQTIAMCFDNVDVIDNLFLSWPSGQDIRNFINIFKNSR